MDLVKGGSLTYSNRHKLRMTQTDPSVIPNDLIIRIIQKGHGGRYGYTHRPQFDRCVDELEKLNTGTRVELKQWLEEEECWMEQRVAKNMFHWDHHEDEFTSWGMFYQWGRGESKFSQQGFSTGLLAGTYKVKLLCGMSSTMEGVGLGGTPIVLITEA